MHSRDTGTALYNAPTSPKGQQLLHPNSVSSSPWPETPLWLSLGLWPTSGLKAMGRCRRPLFLSSGGPRDWMGCHTPPRVVWGHGKTGETGAEAAGLAEGDRTWGQWALQGVGLTSLGSCVQRVELLLQSEGGLLTHKFSHWVPRLINFCETQTQTIPVPLRQTHRHTRSEDSFLRISHRPGTAGQTSEATPRCPRHVACSRAEKAHSGLGRKYRLKAK